MTSRIIAVDPFNLVVFGGAGDLAFRKLIPAMYHRHRDGQLPDEASIYGVSRRTMSDDEYRAAAGAALKEHIDKTESDRRSTALLEKAKQDGSARVYMFILNDTTDIDGNVEGNDARLINHSCEPNVEAQIWEDKEIWFLATRDIQAGEELFYNYGFDLDTWEEHPCCCGSKRATRSCRRGPSFPPPNGSGSCRRSTGSS